MLLCLWIFFFSEYPEFKQHIIKSHEEGREYIKCPVKHCLAPVRDLRFHFKTKHPSMKIPKVCQMRATVWYDVGRKRRKKAVNFKEGYIESAKNNGKAMHYRSGWEKVVYECLEEMGDVISYSVEPFSIPYYHQGKRRQYFPDLKVDFIDGSIEIWEIKPSNQTIVEQVQNKRNAAEVFCTLRGWIYKIITEQMIQKLKNEVNRSN